MAVFLNSLYQDKKTKIVENSKQVQDKIGGIRTTYTNPLKKITLVLSPLTEAEKDSVLTHYLTNYANPIELIVNAYNTGLITVYYEKAPKISIIGKIHFSVTCEFRG